MNNQISILELLNDYKDDKEFKDLFDSRNILDQMLATDTYHKETIMNIFDKYENEIVYVSNVRKKSKEIFNLPYEEYSKYEIITTNDINRERVLVDCLSGILDNIISIRFIKKYKSNELDNVIESLCSKQEVIVYNTVKLFMN